MSLHNGYCRMILLLDHPTTLKKRPLLKINNLQNTKDFFYFI